MNVTEPIRHAARVTPDSAAVIRADGSALSYAFLDHAIDVMGINAQRLGLRAGDLAGLTVTGPDETLGLILLLGLARIGVVTADPALPGDRIRLRFHAGASGPPGSVLVDPGWLPRGVADGPKPRIPSDPDAVLRLFESSGTTGQPKFVIVTHMQMTQRVLLRWIAEGGDPATRIVCVSLSSALGLVSALRTFWRGGTLVLSNPADAAAAIAGHGVTSLVTSPLSLRTMLDGMPPDAGPFASLQEVLVGGSALPPRLYRLAVERLSPHIVSTLGSTETNSYASSKVRDLDERPGAVGYVWPGVEAEAVDEAGVPLPPGTAGRLRIRSPMNATGYFDSDPNRAEQFRDGWFYSSDVGAVWPDRMLTLNGRMNEVINAGGTKVHPQVIEAALLKLPTVLDAAAFGVPDATGVTRIQAAIVARTHIEDAVLSAFCQRMLGPLAPVGILQMKALPRNESGKILRDRLVDIALELMHTAQDGKRPA
ncbi:MAG: long-chain fatty acid--CoA ligase [Proteobacteria bacterium]|nr:long-chain fatty acid--CoA ligase [Pseudomonadota bacterium]